PLALAIWIGGTLRHAARTRVPPQAAALDVAEPGAVDAAAPAAPAQEPMRTSDVIVLLLVVAAFATYVFGILKLGWEFNEMSGLFFAMGIVAGLVGGLGIGGTVDGYIRGFREMAFAGILI